MFTSALHAVLAAVLAITSVPETLSKLEVGVFDEHATHEVVVTSELEQLACL